MPPRKTADQVRKELNAFMKEDVIQFASDPKYIVTYLSTGVFPIDAILQGGLPRGRFTEIYGDYSTFKSYIGYRAIATTQEAGGIAALVDTEHAFDPVWAESLGVNVKDLLIKRPPSGEDAVDVSEILIRQGIDLIVVLAGGEVQQLGSELGQPRRIGRDVQPVHCHAAPDGLGADGLVAPCRECLTEYEGLALAGAAV